MIDVRSLSIPHVLQLHAAATPSATAAISKRGHLTWRELMDRANRIANGLRRLGLEFGDRVVLLFDNSQELLELILGTMVSGVVVPLSGLMTQEVVCRMTRASGARFIFAQDRFLTRFASDDLGQIDIERRFATRPQEGWTEYEPWLARQPAEAPALDYPPDASISILYTSGTTGTPKGMEHSHFSRLLYPLVLGPLLGISRDIDNPIVDADVSQRHLDHDASGSVQRGRRSYRRSLLRRWFPNNSKPGTVYACFPGPYSIDLAGSRSEL